MACSEDSLHYEALHHLVTGICRLLSNDEQDLCAADVVRYLFTCFKWNLLHDFYRKVVFNMLVFRTQCTLQCTLLSELESKIPDVEFGPGVFQKAPSLNVN